jgi:hypothetical protein
MMEGPSLLDVLKALFAQPRLQRLVRFGLAALTAAWGLYLLGSARPLPGVLFFFGLAFGLAMWGLAVRGEAVPLPGIPEASLARRAEVTPSLPSERRPFRTLSGLVFVPAWRLPVALALAVVGQSVLTFSRERYAWGLLFYALGLAAFGWVVWKERLLGAPRADAPAEARPLALRRWLLGVVLAASLIAFLAASGNRFRLVGVAAWVVSVGAWLVAVWDGSLVSAAAQFWERARARWREGAVNVRFTRTLVLLLAVLVVGAYFRYSRLPAIPPEMTSDHVEKLLDVNDILEGRPYVFFERNTGREPLQFYAAVLVIHTLHTGLSHLTLKIVTATAGLLMLPFIFLLGREVEDEAFGLLAALLAAVSFWATTISRMGLRFPLTPLFVAPVLLFLLRGVRRGSRNDFLLAGLFLGMGLYGYSTIRVLPVLVLAGVAWFALWTWKRLAPAQLLRHTGLLLATTLIVFMPLFRYSVQRPDLFWERTLTRVGDLERAVAGSPLMTFLRNQWDAALMFNYLGDDVWANTVPFTPVLDLVTGALFVLGLAYLAARLIARRDAVAGFLLLAIPILLLPSTLNLAFPEENPSLVRAGGAIPVVALVAAYPLWLLLRVLREKLPGPAGAWASVGALAVVAGGAAYFGYDLYFNVYPAQYRLAAQNASEIGAVIRDFAHSVGSYDTAFVRPYPHWADTRAVGMYAGDFGHDFAIQEQDLALPQADPRPKLFILHRHDFTNRPDGQLPSVPELRRLYPNGTLSLYHSAIPHHDFLMYFVPGTQDLDEAALPPPP